MSRMIALLVLCLGLPASAAIVYEPVQYQYKSGNKTYYYGGADPAMHRFANRWVDPRINRDAEGQRSDKPIYVYTDSLPRLNGALFGLRPVDAMNEAYRNMPRYFRKADSLRSARRDETGTIVVPAQPPMGSGTIIIKPWVAPRSLREPRPLIIIPKDQMNLDAPLTPAVNDRKSV